MSSSKKSTSTTDSTQTMTPNAPSWLSPQTQTLQTGTASLANVDPSTYVAGADPLQTQAAQGAAGLTQNGDAYDLANGTLSNLATGDANTYTAATVHPNSILPNLDAYMSPYLNDVVNSTMASYDRNAGQQRQQAMLDLGNMDDTFGGSGGTAYLGNFDASTALNRASTESGLLDQGFQTGANLANLDADRRQQAQLANQAAYNAAGQFNANQVDTAQQRQAAAATGLASLDQSKNADQRANLAEQGTLGSILQQISQAQAQAPLTVQQAINGAYGSLVPADSLMTGQTQTGQSTTNSKTTTGGLGGALGSLGSLAMGLGSLGLSSSSLASLFGNLGGGAGGLTGAADLAAFA